MKNTETVATEGVEFEEENADGRKVKSTITIDNGKMVQVQKLTTGEPFIKITREMVGDLLVQVENINFFLKSCFQ